MREQRARRLILRWPRDPALDPPRFTARLKELLATAAGGDCDVLIRYETDAARCVLGLDRAWAVRPTPELMEGLESLLGPGALRLQYDPAAPESACLSRSAAHRPASYAPATTLDGLRSRRVND